MKLTITGSGLASHLRPLRAVVRQSDEKDFDKIALAIVEGDDDRLYLRAAMSQPTYSAFLCLNLSGSEKAATEGVGTEPIDKDAMPCRGDELWVFPWSRFAACNRSVGAAMAEYVVADDSLDIVLNENDSLHLDVKHCMEKSIPTPVYEDMALMETTTACGVFTANVLQNALHTAMKVCRLGGKNGIGKEQAVHLSIHDTTLTVEALSNTAQFTHTNDIATTIDEKYRAGTHLHISISHDAAQILSEVASVMGKEVRWIYSKEDNTLMVWCDPYILCIDTEEIAGCVCVPMQTEQHGFKIDTAALRRGVMRAKAAGAKAVMMLYHTTGCVELETEDKSVNMRMPSRLYGGGPVCPMSFRLPVNALFALLSGVACRDTVVSFCDTGDYVVVETDEGCLGTVSEV